MGKGQLHELIAVEKDVKGTTEKIIIEAHKTFTDRKDHFTEMFKTYSPINPEDPEKLEGESKPLVTTVADKLTYFEKMVKRHFDVIIQKEATNAIAKADIIVEAEDGTETTVAKDVPVAALVQFENLFERIRAEVYNVIPTLDPSVKWIAPDKARPGVYSTAEITRTRTRKTKKVIQLAPATDKFQAQTQLIDADEPAGYWKQIDRSGMLSPGEKSDLLDKYTRLIEGIKKARARANTTPVVSVKIANDLFGFINS
jgi:hypothetical protein